ncbi:MAG: Zn-ribbon domain-containing OB-fold protein, partial [Dehalococcoidia bacterium]|nr:Zn-ribbon domain-containing OB-fold protein [Dehalococcoidia bacterium]
RKMIAGLCGSKCKRCGMPQYPPQEICANPKCGAVNEMEWYRFSDRKASLFTYTGDVLAFSPSPPAIYGMVNFDGGGRWMFDITDTDLDSVKVGMPVEMSYRRKYHDAPRGIHAYYWKATPIRV